MATEQGDLEARVQRLEESQGFTERTVEELSQEIAEVNKRLAEALAHIRTLEGKLKELLEPPEDGEGDDE